MCTTPSLERENASSVGPIACNSLVRNTYFTSREYADVSRSLTEGFKNLYNIDGPDFESRGPACTSGR